MTAITYTAKRNLVLGGHSFTGTDISADTIADEFNSVTTDISGIPDGYSIYVTGFTNSVNNGWHTLNAASTSTAISVTTNLTTEAAGNTITITDYAHLYGSQYQLECNPYVLNPWERTESAESISQGGLEQSILRRIDSGYQFTTSLITEEQFAYWREFTQSVSGKEPFLFDAFGYIGAADNEEIAVLNGNATFQRVRVKADDTTSSDWRWYISFNVRIL